VRYYTADAGSYLNCGNVGLHGERAPDQGLAASA